MEFQLEISGISGPLSPQDLRDCISLSLDIPCDTLHLNGETATMALSQQAYEQLLEALGGNVSFLPVKGANLRLTLSAHESAPDSPFDWDGHDHQISEQPRPPINDLHLDSPPMQSRQPVTEFAKFQESVKFMVNIGYKDADARRALGESRGNLEVAINFLADCAEIQDVTAISDKLQQEENDKRRWADRIQAEFEAAEFEALRKIEEEINLRALHDQLLADELSTHFQLQQHESDEDVARRLQAEMEAQQIEEQRLAQESLEKEKADYLRELRGDMGLDKCPLRGCQRVLVEHMGDRRRCPSCEFLLCLRCKVQWRTGGCTC